MLVDESYLRIEDLDITIYNILVSMGLKRSWLSVYYSENKGNEESHK